MMNDYGRPAYKGNLSRECATIAQVLQSAGYRSMMCGKWHLSRFTDSGGPKYCWPLQRGFEKFYGTIHGVGSYFNPVTLTRDESFIAPPQGDYYYTDAISDHAAQYVEWAAQSNKPFFLYVAYSAPHWPLHAPAEVVARYQARYAGGWDELREQRHRRMLAMGIVRPEWPLSDRDPRVRPWEQEADKRWQQRRMEVYAAQVDLMDQGIGRIMEKVRQAGAESNTIVMFLSDNGGCAEEVSPTWQGIHIPERARDGRAVQKGNNPNIMPGPADTYQSYGVAWAQASNTPFRLYKHWTHEGGIATPMIVYWPAGIRSGGKLTHAVGHVIDVMPTCLELAKIRYPKILAGYPLKPISGQSLVPLFQGAARQSGAIFWEHEGNRAVRDGQWKLVSRHPGPWELYDMVADRTETNNLAMRFPVIVQDLKIAYEAWAKRANVEQWRK
ncbi:MAG TPA: sulfatase-like hydrolase/transferase, partial [Thermoguttaceae bacterium]|nr:sulfatase-like hydrolase/transferase [Thermoguttaceae bacterium]